ncbi:MAG: potassium-transporting ATPase subunit KdpC [Spongiibacteraceae bacterium]
MMKTMIRPALMMFLMLTLITGVAYPLLVTVISTAAIPALSGGSLIERSGKIVGSELIGQNFVDAKYFWGRLSATGPTPYNAAASSGSNLGPLNPALLDNVKARIDILRAADSGNTAPIPVDLVTASASGLDPHISPAAALYQVARVARVRDLDAARVQGLIARYTEPRQWGIFGEPRVNVLLLNLALDELR